jgi:Sulfatase
MRAGGVAVSDGDRPNILVMWGDDIGISNLSCYSDGLMGYRTPNIDRIALEGMRFTDYYGEQSCTAGRAAFITGQSVFRTGLSKVGLPGADLGLRAEDPTIAELLKPVGGTRSKRARSSSVPRNRRTPGRCPRPTLPDHRHPVGHGRGGGGHGRRQQRPEQADHHDGQGAALVLEGSGGCRNTSVPGPCPRPGLQP